MDVICIQNEAGEYFFTEFYVKFKIPPMDQTSINLLGITDESSNIVSRQALSEPSREELQKTVANDQSKLFPPPAQELVDLYCNNKKCDELIAYIGLGRLLHFYDPYTNNHFTTPDSNSIKAMNLLKGKNKIKCIHRSSNTSIAFNIWVYDVNQRLVVMDIDGTITKSDLTGYIQTVFLGMYTYVHDGIVEFLNTLYHKYHYEIIYLTARPMAHRIKTIQFLEGVRGSDNSSLPEGPLFINKDRIMLALYREVILKDVFQTKSNFLVEIAETFRMAGSQSMSPFVLGIGNKEHDAIAYNSAGIAAERIFLIDPQSQITVWSYSNSHILSKAANKLSSNSSTLTSSTNNTTNINDDNISSSKYSTHPPSQIPSPTPTPPMLSRNNSVKTNTNLVNPIMDSSSKISNSSAISSASSSSSSSSSVTVNTNDLIYVFNSYRDNNLLSYVSRLNQETCL